MVQWLRLCTPNAGGRGPIPGQGTKIPYATWPKNKKQILKRHLMLVPKLFGKHFKKASNFKKH